MRNTGVLDPGFIMHYLNTSCLLESVKVRFGRAY